MSIPSERSRWKDVRAARALSGRAKLRGSPLRVFDSYTRTANGEESEDDEERLLYFLMENEFFSGRTCTLTPDRALAGLQAMPAAAVAQMTPDVEAVPASPARDALRQHKGISQLPSRSELLDVSSSDSEEGGAKPPKPPSKPRPASPPAGAPIDDGWARRWQPNPSEEQVLAAADRLLLTQARRRLRVARLRRGMRGLIAAVTKAMERLSWMRQEELRELALGWSRIRRASARLAELAALEDTLRTSRLAKGLLAWRGALRRQAEVRLLLAADSFRRMWLHAHTQRLARELMCEEEGGLCEEEGGEQSVAGAASHRAAL